MKQLSGDGELTAWHISYIDSEEGDRRLGHRARLHENPATTIYALVNCNNFSFFVIGY